MHMLVAPDGGGGELQPYGAQPAEQELELLRDNADDGLEGHVRYVAAPKSCSVAVLVANHCCASPSMVLAEGMVSPLGVPCLLSEEQ